MASRTIRVPTHRPPTSIGEILEEEYRKPLGFTQAAFAEKLGIDRVRYSEVVHNRRALSTDTAQRLSHVLETSVEFWMNLQHMADVYKAKSANVPAEIALLKPIRTFTPVCKKSAAGTRSATAGRGRRRA